MGVSGGVCSDVSPFCARLPLFLPFSSGKNWPPNFVFNLLRHPSNYLGCFESLSFCFKSSLFLSCFFLQMSWYLPISAYHAYNNHKQWCCSFSSSPLVLPAHKPFRQTPCAPVTDISQMISLTLCWTSTFSYINIYIYKHEQFLDLNTWTLASALLKLVEGPGSSLVTALLIHLLKQIIWQTTVTFCTWKLSLVDRAWFSLCTALALTY